MWYHFKEEQFSFALYTKRVINNNKYTGLKKVSLLFVSSLCTLSLFWALFKFVYIEYFEGSANLCFLTIQGGGTLRQILVQYVVMLDGAILSLVIWWAKIFSNALFLLQYLCLYPSTEGTVYIGDNSFSIKQFQWHARPYRRRQPNGSKNEWIFKQCVKLLHKEATDLRTSA